jgi:hypothetical protein
MTIMNEKAKLTDEQNGSLAKRYRAVRLLLYVGLEMNTVIPPVKYCFTYGIRNSEVE